MKRKRFTEEQIIAVLREHESSHQPSAISYQPDAGGEMQLTLFTPAAQKIADRLAAVNPDTLTPLEALNLIAELKAEVSGG